MEESLRNHLSREEKKPENFPIEVHETIGVGFGALWLLCLVIASSLHIGFKADQSDNWMRRQLNGENRGTAWMKEAISS